MNTLYVLGKIGFRGKVLKNVGRTFCSVLPGETIDHGTEHECQLFWLPETIGLREFKKCITSSVVFRYRLRFFTSADEYYLYKIETESIEQQDSNEVEDLNLPPMV